MKEHIQAKMINHLRNIAREFHSHDCLRELIANSVRDHLKEDEEWKKNNPDPNDFS